MVSASASGFAIREETLRSGDDRNRFRISEVFSPGIRKNALAFVLRYNTFLIFVGLIIVAAIVSDRFFTERNIFNLLRQVSGIGIISLGMLLVILTGGIDLSVGSVLAFGSVMVAYFSRLVALPVSLLLTVALAAAIGTVSGYLVAKRAMAPFVATLAFMTIARGIAFMVSRGSPIILGDAAAGLREFGRGYFLRVPYPVFLMFGIFLVVALILRYTVFGRLVTAIGSNENAVRLSGVNVAVWKLSVYTISAALASVGGIISTSRTGVGSPIVGTALELDAIAACVIGGASLSGGRGTALNTLLGAIILGMIGNVMNLMNVPGYPQQVIKGVIIIMAVLVQGVSTAREE